MKWSVSLFEKKNKKRKKIKKVFQSSLKNKLVLCWISLLFLTQIIFFSWLGINLNYIEFIWTQDFISNVILLFK